LPRGRRARFRFDGRRGAGGAGDLVFALLAATPPACVAPRKGAVLVGPLARRNAVIASRLLADGADAPALLWPIPERGRSGASG
jgi:hypothetical protein